MEFIDFVITIERLGEGLVISCPDPEGGTIIEPMTLPFDEAGVEELRLLVEGEGLKAAMAAAGGPRRGMGHQPIGSQAESLLVQRGAAIFESVFHGQIKAAFEAEYSEARGTGRGLRVKVRTGPQLAMYPFEIMYCRGDPLPGLHLALLTGLTLTRGRIGRPGGRLNAIKPPLRILVVGASPQDMDPIDIDEEMRNLGRALDLPGIDVQFISGPNTMGRINREIDREYHVLHFIGHGIYDKATQRGRIIFEDPKGRTRRSRDPT